MYSEQQKRDHVYDLQRFLRRIQREENHPNPLAPDGIYGPETEQAVREFQLQHGLPPRGTADYHTWTLIYEHFVPLSTSDTPPQAALFFPPAKGTVLSPGAKGNSVAVLQMMLNTVATHFANMPQVPVTGLYDEETSMAIVDLQNKFRIAPTGLTDRTTWDLLTQLHNAYYERPPLSWIIAEQD